MSKAYQVLNNDSITFRKLKALKLFLEVNDLSISKRRNDLIITDSNGEGGKTTRVLLEEKINLDIDKFYYLLDENGNKLAAEF